MVLVFILGPRRLMKPEDRIIVALDVPTRAEAFRFIDDLEGLISFYKVGLELLLGGGLQDLSGHLAGKQVFVDLKLPDDIPATVGNVVRVAAEAGAKFLTLSHSVGPATLRAAINGRGERRLPELLWVPVLSSMDAWDFAARTSGKPEDFHTDLVRRAKSAAAAGADGFIVSGQEIAVLRAEFPNAPLVSPGIRPAWAASDDHKRVCTPAEAIRLGADYIVVGRPIRNAGNRDARRAAAQRIIDELAGPF
ncbi:MAG: orotidine-5'-phosphate decarboxylase [Polyangiaceae bacterium]